VAGWDSIYPSIPWCSRTRTIRLFFGFMARRQGSYKGHKWTEEELNLVCYLRYIRHWRFTQIQRAKFPLLSRHSVGGAYRSLPPQERTHRALAAVPVNTRPRNITESQSQPSFSNTIPRHSHHSTANNETRDTTLDTNGDNPFVTTQIATTSGQTDPQSLQNESHVIWWTVTVSLIPLNHIAVLWNQTSH
jgi:hypothetical protein